MSWRDASADLTREIPLLTSCYGALLRKYPGTAGEGRVWAQAPTHSRGIHSVLGKALPAWAEERRADSLNHWGDFCFCFCFFFPVSGAACKRWHSAETAGKYLFYRTGYCLCFSPNQGLIPKATGNVHTNKVEV